MPLVISIKCRMRRKAWLGSGGRRFSFQLSSHYRRTPRYGVSTHQLPIRQPGSFQSTYVCTRRIYLSCKEHYRRPQWTQAFTTTSHGTSSAADMAKGLKLQRERSWDLRHSGFQLCLTCQERSLCPSTLPSTSFAGTKRSLCSGIVPRQLTGVQVQVSLILSSHIYCKYTLIYRIPPKVISFVWAH